MYRYHGQSTEAEKMWKRALTGYEKALEPDHPDTLMVVQNLGTFYHGRGQFEEAEKMLKQALTGYEKALQQRFCFISQEQMSRTQKRSS